MPHADCFIVYGCIVDRLKEYHSPCSVFSELPTDTSVLEWAPMSIGKKSDNWIVRCHTFSRDVFISINVSAFMERTGEFLAQMASNAENVSIWWRRHVVRIFLSLVTVFSATLTSIIIDNRHCDKIHLFSGSSGCYDLRLHASPRTFQRPKWSIKILWRGTHSWQKSEFLCKTAKSIMVTLQLYFLG